MNKAYVEHVLRQVQYKDWKFRVMEKGDGFLIQAVFNEPDCHTGKMTEQHGRKWYVSSHACKSEIVQTVWAAVERAVLHEAKEAFLYRGTRIMNPHIDVDQMCFFAEAPGVEQMREDNRPKPGAPQCEGGTKPCGFACVSRNR